MGGAFSQVPTDELQRIWLKVCYAERPGLNAKTALQQRLGETEFIAFWLKVEEHAGRRFSRNEQENSGTSTSKPAPPVGPLYSVSTSSPATSSANSVNKSKSAAGGEKFARQMFNLVNNGKPVSWQTFYDTWRHREGLSRAGYPEMPWISV